MPRSNPTATASEMLGSLKAKLGFSRDGQARSGFEPSRGFDEEDEGFSQRWDDEYAGYGADYDETAPVGGYRPARTRGSRFGRADSTPDLVSIDDVKASTPVPDRLLRDPLEGGRGAGGASSKSASGRSLIDDTAPAASSPAYNASLRSARARSEGYNSLFEPSGAQPSAAASSFDPYEAYSASRTVGPVSARSLAVIRPVSYDDVERVAKAVKSGDVAVLALRSVSDDLAKRVLDFSFGVASALDANVECPAAKVFAISRASALSEDEKRELRSQGVL